MNWWVKNRALGLVMLAAAVAAMLTSVAGSTRFPIPTFANNIPLSFAYFVPVIISVAVGASLSRSSLTHEARAIRRIGLYDALMTLSAFACFSGITLLAATGTESESAQIGIRTAAALLGLTLICRSLVAVELAPVLPLVYLLASAILGGQARWAWITHEGQSVFSSAAATTALVIGTGLVAVRIARRKR